MRDTVELLEAIGRDAHLRHASPEELAKALKEADASKGLLEMVNHGDSTALTAELGLVHMHVEHQSQTGGHEGDEEHHHPHHPHHPDHPKHDDDHGGDKEHKPTPRPAEPKDTPAD